MWTRQSRSTFLSGKSGKPSQVPFRFPRVVTGAAVGAALLFLSVQGANAASKDGMQNMEGMRNGAPASEFRFGEPGKAAKVDRTVKVTMREMSFKPTSLKVKVGETIRFIVTNTSEIDHDFTIGDIAAQTEHREEMAKAAETGGEMEHGDDPNAITVKAGQSGELIWRFTRVGSLEFDCNIPGHYEAGMKGVIAVLGKGGGANAGAPATSSAAIKHKTNASKAGMQ